MHSLCCNPLSGDAGKNSHQRSTQSCPSCFCTHPIPPCWNELYTTDTAIRLSADYHKGSRVMENTTLSFPHFPQLPKELRLRIWGLALPGPCIITQVWNQAKAQCEFVRNIPAVLHASSEARVEFLRTPDKPVASPAYVCIMDVKPFYFCYALDTIYVPCQCLFNLALDCPAAYLDIVQDPHLQIMRKQLRSLQMDWGMEPYWWRGSHQAGPILLRSLPRLEIFTLVVTISKLAWEDGEKETLVDIVKRHIATQFSVEQTRHPEWRLPLTNFHCRKDSADWSIRSLSKSLLPDTRLLYDCASQ